MQRKEEEIRSLKIDLGEAGKRRQGELRALGLGFRGVEGLGFKGVQGLGSGG